MVNQAKQSEISPATVPSLPSPVEDDKLDEKKRSSSDGGMDAAVPYLSSQDEKDLEGESAQSEEEMSPYLKISWKYKWIALLCTAAFPIGQTWTDEAMGPLKSTLREELGINNTQFGVIGSAGSIINSIWPILGGIALDHYGVNIVSLFCTSGILFGSIIAALGINLVQWRMLVAGHVLMGFGTAVLDSAQHKLFYHWFGYSGLAMAFGLESAVAKTVSLVAGMTAIPIANKTGWYGWCFWIPVAFCAFSLVVNVIYVFFERRVIPKHLRLTSVRAHAMSGINPKKQKLSFASIWLLPWAFWMLPMTQLLQSGAAGGFGQSSADLIEMKGYTREVAGFTSSARNILPIVLTPIIGLLVDRFGHRFHLTAAAPLFWITSCAVIGWSSIHPLVAVVIASLGETINAFPFQITIPLLVADQSKLGTAFGIWRAFNNSGSTIMEIIFGVLQDGTNAMGYEKVLILSIALKTVAFILGCSYIFIDFRLLGKGMTLSEKARMKREEVIEDRDADPLTARPVNLYVTKTALSLLFGIVVTAWVLFLKYLIDPSSA